MLISGFQQHGSHAEAPWHSAGSMCVNDVSIKVEECGRMRGGTPSCDCGGMRGSAGGELPRELWLSGFMLLCGPQPRKHRRSGKIAKAVDQGFMKMATDAIRSQPIRTMLSPKYYHRASAFSTFDNALLPHLPLFQLPSILQALINKTQPPSSMDARRHLQRPLHPPA